ncbi:MAG: response regulator [Candidatus Accumulibacter sp.]|uniref:Response regulator n=1 Tax=Candidatus Accumulibacter cognatus TaxID=2954383 RepID=A0A7D5NFX8_9PROT|nr:HD domain-containing phosphohydrolase [Accumulibacter sp.]MBL8401191.1 response regulator [Accumulibacter sp.]MCM8620465.1 response regulator [Accumulibacter sp.]QLH52211.1 MAG: response regulator [Candidatus Accumulibacter cognatus]HRE16546.1 response regulator [Rhodocyclaceae bacterium]
MPSGPILIVDDEPQNLAALRHVLDEHYMLAFATSGEMALEVVAKRQPALILLDVRMPDLDGFEVCRRLKANPALEAIPVIFVTSLADVWDEARGFEVGAVDYITKPISPAIVLARVRTHLSLVRAHRLEKSYRDAIYMLGTAGHYNDTDTGVHIWRMAAYSRALAQAAGWPDEDCKRLEMAAPMHDTGKIGIPSNILRKPAKLDAAEWEVMKTHARLGHDILKKSDAPVFQLAAEVALRHHEKWDGSGYPDGLVGDAIPESARIVALADVFDALTMRRPYKEPWPIEKTVVQIREASGSHFEPRLVELFVGILPELLAIRERWNTQDPA